MKIKERLTSWGHRLFDEGEIVLSRVPRELRQELFNSNIEDLSLVMKDVNGKLEILGMQPLNHQEMEDASQANYIIYQLRLKLLKERFKHLYPDKM
ncbi:hypothetical protein HY404_00130 [Candidatus Microgenomates bacterium]|nr:hypothetical protein [Candidatus Microgenomates bacterium]